MQRVGCGEMGGFVQHWGLAGSKGTLPSWHWRAASPGGELAPIRAKLQLNYFSYTGIIPISSSHLMLSLLFCLGSICPEFFLLLCWSLPWLKASPVLQVLCVYALSLVVYQIVQDIETIYGKQFPFDEIASVVQKLDAILCLSSLTSTNSQLETSPQMIASFVRVLLLPFPLILPYQLLICSATCEMELMCRQYLFIWGKDCFENEGD